MFIGGPYGRIPRVEGFLQQDKPIGTVPVGRVNVWLGITQAGRKVFERFSVTRGYSPRHYLWHSSSSPRKDDSKGEERSANDLYMIPRMDQEGDGNEKQ